MAKEKGKSKKETKPAPTFTLSAKDPRAKQYLGWIKNDYRNRGVESPEIDKAIKDFADFNG